MQILGIEHAVPERILSNDEVIDRITVATRDTLSARELKRVLSHLSNLFHSTGLKSRHITNHACRPIDLVTDAAKRALKSAGLTARDLDFIIYGGVGRGYLVPSCASAVQYAIGASGVQSFDVLDACASWARAMQISQKFLASKSNGAGLIVNCECGFYDDYDVWSIRSAKDIEMEGGFFTIGEAATATVVGPASNGAGFEFHSRTYGEYGDLATLPIVKSHSYMSHKRQQSGPLRFYTRSNELTFNGFRIGLELMKKIDPLRGRTVDAFVPHAGAAPSIGMFVKAAKLESPKLIMSYQDYGNTVSASIPLGLSLAIGDERIKRGDKVFAAVIAAGISAVSLLFDY